MAWVILAISIAFEVVGTTMMKLSQGLTVLWPSVGVFVCYAGSLAGVTIVLKYIELSITYAIWSGVGTVATAIIGMTYFKEPVTLMKIACIGLVIAGVVGLQLASQGVRE